MTETKSKKFKLPFDISSTGLHIIAMFLMLLDHMWATVTPSQTWMTTLGRIAFPIFAFMTIEGFYHTHNFKKYMLRILAFAVISEIPFNIMTSGNLINPTHQNVMWTFLIGLGGVWIIDTVKKRGKLWVTILVSIVVVIACTALGFACIVDFFGFGVLTVFVFYFFHGRKWWCLLGQFACLYWLNVEMLGGYCFVWTIFGHEFWIVQQGFALLALIPIWLYVGRKGPSNKVFQYFCYAFYPLHALILGLLMMLK